MVEPKNYGGSEKSYGGLKTLLLEKKKELFPLDS